MNQTTTDVIQFLTDPELDFGDNLMDVELLEAPEMLRETVSNLLASAPSFMASPEAAAELRARLGEADWPLIAREFQERVKMARRFFENGTGDAAGAAR